MLTPAYVDASTLASVISQLALVRESAPSGAGTPAPPKWTVASAAQFSFSPDAAVSALGVSALASLGASPGAAFWTAAALVERGEHAKARDALVSLMRDAPDDDRAAALLEIWKSKVREEGTRALAWAGVALVAGVALAFIFSRRRPARPALPAAAFPAGAAAGAVAGAALAKGGAALAEAASDVANVASAAYAKGGRGKEVGAAVGARVGSFVEDAIFGVKDAVDRISRSFGK
jgi:hypothetical protein